MSKPGKFIGTESGLVVAMNKERREWRVTANRFRVSFFFLKISGINGNNHSPL
jgi:hypothetical protein